MKKTGFSVFSDRRAMGPASDAKAWLVKSGDRILGPFSTDEVVERLRSRDTVVIDEVITPCGRWRVLRDEPVFRAVIEEIRRGSSSFREDTEIQGYTGSGVTQSTEPDTNPRGRNDFVPAARVETPPETLVTSVGGQESPAAVLRDFGRDFGRDFVRANNEDHIQEAEFTEHIDRPAAAAAGARVRQYGVQGTKVQTSSVLPKVLWSVAILAMALAGIVVLRAHPGAEGASHASFSAHAKRADRAWQEGDFPDALKALRAADHEKPGQPEIVARLAPLMVRFESQTAQAKRMVDEVLAGEASKLNPRTHAELETSLALCALAGEDWQEAKLHLDRAAALPSADLTAVHFDLGVTAFRRRDFEKAVREFGAIENEPAARVMTARSLFEMNRSPGQGPIRISAEAGLQADTVLSKVVVENQDFLQEAHLLKAVLNLVHGDLKAANTEARLTLDTDPELTHDHRHHPYYDFSLLAWRELVPDCQFINDSFHSTISKSLFSLCLFKAGDRDRANQVLSEALGPAPEDPYLQSAHAYSLAGADRLEDARAALKAISNGARPVLADLVLARVCQRTGDYACALAEWTSLAEHQPPVLAAYVGLADITNRSGEPDKATDWIGKARALSPTYAPVLGFHPGRTTK